MINQQSICGLIFFPLLFFVFNKLSAQEDTTRAGGQLIEDQFKINLNHNFQDFQPVIFDLQNSKFITFPSTTLNTFNFSNYTITNSERINLTQNKNINYLPNLGSFEHYNNSAIFNVSNKFKIDFSFGLLKQNTVLTSNNLNFQYTFGTSLEYEIYPWLSFYIYGQLLIPSVKNSTVVIDPLTYMNPLFYQSEVGGGLRSKYKNIKADVGLKQIYDTQFNQANPVKSMNTKISIGF